MKRMFAAAKTDKSNDLLLYLYDVIGGSFFYDGITAKDIADELAKAGKIDSITVRINSPGGSVFQGVSIFNLLRTQGVPVNVMVDGVAASAASVVAMAGDKITMADNALLMIHNAWMEAAGDANELRKVAETLDKVSGTLVETYAKRTCQAAEDVQAMMDAETWMDAKEALAKGFATEIYERDADEGAQAMALAASFDLKRHFAKVPDALAEPPKAAEPEPEPVDHSARELELRRLELAAMAA